MASVTISIRSRAGAALVAGGTTNSSNGTISSPHCLGDLEPVHVGGLGIHIDSFRQTFSCQDPSQTVGDCEFDPNSQRTPPRGNRVQVISRSFLFFDRTTFKWYLSGCSGRRSRWGLSLGVGYINITWNVVNVRPR